jgi:hypothetical protein
MAENKSQGNALTHPTTSDKMLAMNLSSMLARLLWFAIWIALAIYFLLTLWLGIVGLLYPYQLDYGEGIVLCSLATCARSSDL